MCNRAVFAALLSVGVVFGGNAALAFDPDRVIGVEQEPRSVLRYGVDALRDGRTDDAIGAFRHGAVQNHLPSQWKLARMYQQGVGLRRDDLAAFELFQAIADRYAEKAPTRIEQPYVAHAVVAVGLYRLNGIDGTYVLPNPRLAEHLLFRAAALYKSDEAQFQLGYLYAGNTLGTPRPKRAARWLELASRKGHPEAQAMLGEMLFYGMGIRRNRVKGLVYLTRAAANGKIERLREARLKAFSLASSKQRDAADKIISRLSPSQPSTASAAVPQTQVFGFQASTPEVSE